MSYIVKHKGKRNFRTIDLQCPECGYEEEKLIDCREQEDDQTPTLELKCPNCDCEKMDQVWKHAPSMKIGNDRDPRNIARMQKSLQERFVKKEIDEVRHKHGKLFDDSLRSAAAQKIKKRLKK
jgi:transcriptional regulator NrdR family protein